jgi:hypothetical protein
MPQCQNAEERRQRPPECIENVVTPKALEGRAALEAGNSEGDSQAAPGNGPGRF